MNIRHSHRRCSAGAAGAICRKTSVRFYLWKVSEDLGTRLFGRCILHIPMNDVMERKNLKRLTTEELEVAELMES